MVFTCCSWLQCIRRTVHESRSRQLNHSGSKMCRGVLAYDQNVKNGFFFEMAAPTIKKRKKSGKMPPFPCPDFEEGELEKALSYLENSSYSQEEVAKLCDPRFNILLNDYLPIDRTEHINWCICQNCCNDANVRQNFCCAEVELASDLTEKQKNLKKVRKRFLEKFQSAKTSCIANHPSFEVVMLNREVLSVWIEDARGDKKLRPMIDQLLETDKNRVFRHYAYRSFARWAFGHLSRGQRYEIPACARKKIVDTFPSEGYTGFQLSDLVLNESVY